ELLDVERSLLDGRRVDLESARLRFEVADASQVDVLDAEVQVTQQEITIERQRATLEQALLQLRQTLGGEEVAAITPQPLPVFDPADLDEETLIRTALTRNPDLQAAEVDLRGARIGVRESNEAWWPTLNLQYNFSRTSQDTETQALLDFSYDEQDFGSRFFVQLSVPAFNDFFGMRQQQASSRVQLANQEVQVEQQRLQVEVTVRAASSALRNEWRTLQLADRSAEIARRSSELAREEYRLGLRTFEELQTTVEQEATARRQALASRYAFVTALLDLESVVGVRLRPDGLVGVN
ncbi:MAG TPA: TolC family protein, partial [Myxococcota bacterium]|nr:TolC family protein [Myxococcota bacterium]